MDLGLDKQGTFCPTHQNLEGQFSKETFEWYSNGENNLYYTNFTCGTVPIKITQYSISKAHFYYNY